MTVTTIFSFALVKNKESISVTSVVNGPVVFLLDQLGDFEFAGDLGLAQAAPRNRNSVFLLFSGTDYLIEVREALLFVVTSGRDGSRRAASYASLAGLIKIV
jgi:hypothetical protein